MRVLVALLLVASVAVATDRKVRQDDPLRADAVKKLRFYEVLVPFVAVEGDSNDPDSEEIATDAMQVEFAERGVPFARKKTGQHGRAAALVEVHFTVLTLKSGSTAFNLSARLLGRSTLEAGSKSKDASCLGIVYSHDSISETDPASMPQTIRTLTKQFAAHVAAMWVEGHAKT